MKKLLIFNFIIALFPQWVSAEEPVEIDAYKSAISQIQSNFELQYPSLRLTQDGLRYLPAQLSESLHLRELTYSTGPFGNQRNSGLEDISSIASLSELVRLDIRLSQGTDISAIGYLENLKHLTLNSLGRFDICSAITENQDLVSASFNAETWSEFSCLLEMTALEELLLNVDECETLDVAAIAESNIKRLTIFNCKSGNLDDIASSFSDDFSVSLPPETYISIEIIRR